MKRCYALLFALVPIIMIAQPQLPGFLASDTVTIPCPQDSSVYILTYTGWEAYQTLDDTFHGERDPNVCIDLAHLVGVSVAPRILFDQIDPSRPVFLRALLDDDNVIALASNTQYSIGMSAYGTTGLDEGPCPDGPCSSLHASVRIPDASGISHDLRWYESAYDDDMWNAYPFILCLPTEKFESNDLREFVLSLKAIDPQPGGSFNFFYTEVADLEQWGMLVKLTENLLPQYNTGPLSYGFYWDNFLVMHDDTTYPDEDNIYTLEFTPVPNLPEQAEVTVTLGGGSGFNFQPFTQLGGGPVLGNDSLHHTLTVVNQGADLCFSWQIVELVWEPGDRYIHHSGHLGFEGLRSCFMFKPGSTMEVAPNSTLHYGRTGRGMLALINGSNLVIGADGELVMHGPLIIMDPPNATEQQDMHVTLMAGARLSFAPGSMIHNANSIDQAMRLVVTLDGGSIDISGLSAEDQQKVVVIELPREELTPFNILGNPARDELVLSFASRNEGSMTFRCIDVLGRPVFDRSATVVLGSNRVALPIQYLRQGNYILEATINGERRVVRFVKE